MPKVFSSGSKPYGTETQSGTDAQNGTETQ